MKKILSTFVPAEDWTRDLPHVQQTFYRIAIKAGLYSKMYRSENRGKTTWGKLFGDKTYRYCIHFISSGGNQREKSREKAAKKQKEADKKKAASDKGANKGMTLEERRHR